MGGGGTVKSVKKQVKVISKVTISIGLRSPLPIETSDFSHSGPDLLHPLTLQLLFQLVTVGLLPLLNFHLQLPLYFVCSNPVTHPESLFLLIKHCFQVAGYSGLIIGITMNLCTGYVNISTKLDVIRNAVSQSINIITKGLTETIPVSCFQATLQRFNGFIGQAFHSFGGDKTVV